MSRPRESCFQSNATLHDSPEEEADCWMVQRLEHP